MTQPYRRSQSQLIVQKPISPKDNSTTTYWLNGRGMSK